MQKWDYLQKVALFVEDFGGIKGSFLKPEIKGAPTWCIQMDGTDIPSDEALTQLGDEGWELVTAVVQHTYGDAWNKRTTSRWLCFKRPKL